MKVFFTIFISISLIVPCLSTRCWECTSFNNPHCTEDEFDGEGHGISKPDCLKISVQKYGTNYTHNHFQCFKIIFRGHARPREKAQQELGYNLVPHEYVANLQDIYQEPYFVARGCIPAERDPLFKGKRLTRTGIHDNCRLYTEDDALAQICTCGFSGDQCNGTNTLHWNNNFWMAIFLLGLTWTMCNSFKYNVL